MDPIQAITGHPITTAITALALMPVVVVIYRLFFHPLARIPGPLLGRSTRLWYAYHTRKGRARELTKMLHEKYGPIVRVTPNMVWFNTAEGFKEVYSMLSS